MIMRLLSKIGFQLRNLMASPEQRASLCSKQYGMQVGCGCLFFGRSLKFGSEPYLISMGNQVMLSNNVQFVTHEGGSGYLRIWDWLKGVTAFLPFASEIMSLLGLIRLFSPE